LANRVAGLSIEGHHGSDANPIRGFREQPASKDKSGRAGQESNAAMPSTAGKVMALISGRAGGGECRTFRLESEDMFVNPFAGPWNDEAVLVRFRHDLASHPEKLEEILAAYVRQDPALAPRLLSLALARRPLAAIKLASVAASAGPLGRMGVLGLLLAATATGVLGSSDQGNAAEPRSPHPTDTNGISGSTLMSASAVAALLVGAGSALAASSATIPTSGGENSQWHSGSAAHGDEAIGNQSEAGADAAAAGATATSYDDLTNFGVNAETSGSGRAPGSALNHAVSQRTAQTTDLVHGITHPAIQDGVSGPLHNNDTGDHGGHVADPMAGWNDQSGSLLISSEDRNPGSVNGFDITSSEKGTDTDAPSTTAFGDAWLGVEKGVSSSLGVGAETVSSFLTPGAATSSPTTSFSTSGSGGYDLADGLTKGAVDSQQHGQTGTSSLLGASDAAHGAQQIVLAGFDGMGWANGASLPGLQSATGDSGPHDAAPSDGLAPANAAPLGLDGLATAVKEIGAAVAFPSFNSAPAMNLLSAAETHIGSFLSFSEVGTGVGSPGQTVGTAPAYGAPSQTASEFGAVTSFLHEIESGASGAGTGATSLPLANNGQVIPSHGSSLPVPNMVDTLHSVDAFPTQAAAGAGAQFAMPTIAGSNHASSAIESSVNHALADAFSWQGGSSGGEHSTTASTLADWTHVGFGHSG